MNFDGHWVGWYLGDVDPEIGELKAFMRRKFSFARRLTKNDTYDQPTIDAVKKMQSHYGVLVTGILDTTTKRCMGLVRTRDVTLPTLFTVHGTAQPDPLGPGLPADMARSLLDVYVWQPIGNYPAQAFPMWPSVQLGVAELRLQINRYPGPFALAGYSQGAIVTSFVFKQDILNPEGALHHRLPDLMKAVTWGNPMAEMGHSFPGDPDQVPGRGIMDDRLRNTPDWWWDFRHHKDIYTDTPDDDMGEDYTAICKIVMGSGWFMGPNSIIAQVLEVVQRPVPECIAMIQAVVGAGMFFGAGMNSPHFTYDIRPAVEYLRAPVARAQTPRARRPASRTPATKAAVKKVAAKGAVAGKTVAKKTTSKAVAKKSASARRA